MSRLIDADALMATLGITDMDCVKCAWYSKSIRRCKRGGDFEDACCAIENAPTIEPERRKGRWIKPTGMMPPEHTGRHCCSECYEFAPVDWKTRKEELTDYCPHCGLKMEAEG